MFDKIVKVVGVVALLSIANSINSLVEKYDETKALAIRCQSLEDDIREMRGSVNTVGTIALTTMEREQTFLQEVQDAVRFKLSVRRSDPILRKASEGKGAPEAPRNKNREGSPEVPQGGKAATP